MDSDQTTLNKTTGAISVLRAARSRVTSIQGRGEAGSVLLLHDAATTGAAGSGNLKATYRFETEGLDLYVTAYNLLDDKHVEYYEYDQVLKGVGEEFSRSIWGGFSWRF